MAEDRMCYVAEDPAQPGAAWAAAVDDPKYAKENAKAIAEWIADGAVLRHVTVADARAMLMKWVRPAETKPDTNQLSLI